MLHWFLLHWVRLIETQGLFWREKFAALFYAIPLIFYGGEKGFSNCPLILGNRMWNFLNWFMTKRDPWMINMSFFKKVIFSFQAVRPSVYLKCEGANLKIDLWSYRVFAYFGLLNPALYSVMPGFVFGFDISYINLTLKNWLTSRLNRNKLWKHKHAINNPKSTCDIIVNLPILKFKHHNKSVIFK